VGMFNGPPPTVTKKVVGVFVRFSCAASMLLPHGTDKEC
jgi:hypothetical protein